jgi:hypothetical protein
MISRKSSNGTIVDRVHTVAMQSSKETQHFGTIARLPIALEASICAASVANLNQVLVDTKTLADMYKKHHWQVCPSSTMSSGELRILIAVNEDGLSSPRPVACDLPELYGGHDPQHRGR